MRGRLLAIAAAGAGVAAILTAGLVLAAGDDENAAPASTATSTTQPEPAGERAPALAGTNPIDGKPVKLADFKGKPVVINIWASWCAPCNDEAPDYARFAERHPEAVVLGVDLQDSVPEAKAFYRKHGWKHPSIFDPQGELAAKLGLVGMPTTIFLTADHRESTRIVGAADLESLEQGLAEAAPS